MKPSENRVENAINDWQAREQRHERLFSTAVVKGRDYQKDTLAHYEQLLSTFGQSQHADERATLRRVTLEKRKLEKQLYPGLFVRLIRRAVLMAIKPVIRNQQISRAADSQQRLQQQLSEMGFKNTENRLKQMISQGKDSFTMPVSWYASEKERMDFDVSFRKQHNGSYKLESYKAALTDPENPTQKREHQFRVKDTGTVTASQASGLLAGRCIHKEGTWQQLDFNDKDAQGNFRVKQFHQNYGFDLVKALRELPLKEFKNGVARGDLLTRLGNGEKVEVILKVDGKEHKAAVEANAQFKTLNIYDQTGQKLHSPAALGKEVKVEQKQEQRATQSLKVSRRNGMSIG